MLYSNLSKTIALSFGVLAMAFLIGFIVLAWTEPTAAPPGDNVPAPLNVGPDGQAKEGGLILNTGGASIGLIVDQGNVGIGTATPTAGFELDVAGNVRVGGNLRTTGLVNCNTIDTDAAGNLMCGIDDTGVGVGACSDCDGRFVNVTGDTMTGDLTVSGSIRFGTGVAGDINMYKSSAYTAYIDQDLRVAGALLGASITSNRWYYFGPGSSFSWDNTAKRFYWHDDAGFTRMHLDGDTGDLYITGKLTQAGCPDYSDITPLEFIQESINKTEHTTQEEVDALMRVVIEQVEQIKKLTKRIEALEAKINQ